jgi:hypothetical protein
MDTLFLPIVFIVLWIILGIKIALIILAISTIFYLYNVFKGMYDTNPRRASYYKNIIKK